MKLNAVYMKLLIWWLTLFVLLSCSTPEQHREKVAKQSCSGCHLFPEPSLLPRSTWTNDVLPNMAFRMGLTDLMDGLDYFPQQDLLTVVSTLPKNRMVDEETWATLVEYYTQNSPDSIRNEPRLTLDALHDFELIPFQVPDADPLVTLVRINPAKKEITYGTRQAELLTLSRNLKVIDQQKLSSPPSWLVHEDSLLLLSVMGIMDPNDQPKGKIQLRSDSTWLPLIDSLKRPVHFEVADLTGDGQKEFIVSSFGNFTGDLSIYENLGNRTYKRHILSNLPGNRLTLIRDFNHDQRPDILTLITQGDEQITLFINRGDFEFEAKTLLRLPPVYGSSYFELQDFNNDGLLDILYSNGDNSDYSQILKPYHGVRIFLQTRDMQFTESWFAPMHGASKALARDFDSDGDLDIAAIAFFPDFQNQPEGSFIYFENQDSQFVPKTIPGNLGRWVVMDAADWDGDSDIDLVLGALNFTTQVPPALASQWKTNPVTLLILSNNKR